MVALPDGQVLGGCDDAADGRAPFRQAAHRQDAKARGDGAAKVEVGERTAPHRLDDRVIEHPSAHLRREVFGWTHQITQKTCCIRLAESITHFFLSEKSAKYSVGVDAKTLFGRIKGEYRPTERMIWTVFIGWKSLHQKINQ